jgi:hypothetical protein
MDSQQIEEPHATRKKHRNKGKRKEAASQKEERCGVPWQWQAEESHKEEERLLPLNKAIMPGRWETFQFPFFLKKKLGFFKKLAGVQPY